MRQYQGGSIRTYINRVLKEYVTEQRSDEVIAFLLKKVKLPFFLKPFVKIVLDKLMPEQLISMVDALLEKAGVP